MGAPSWTVGNRILTFNKSEFMRHNQSRRSRSRSSRKGPNPLTRSYESNGPDVKVRGTASHVAEKYMTLARDALASGDTVSAENYLQHAEHYNRIVMAAQAQYQQSQPQYREGSDEGYDDDRSMNGRPRDRFESNVEGRDDDGDERYDNGNGEDDRGGYRPMQARQNDQEQQSRPQSHNDRNDRNDRNERNDRNDRGGSDRGGERNDRGDRNDRYERRDRPDYRDNGRSSARHPGDEPQPDLPERALEAAPAAPAAPSPEAAPASAAAAPSSSRRKRSRSPRSEAEQSPSQDGDSTPDGAAALAAFPE